MRLRARLWMLTATALVLALGYGGLAPAPARAATARASLVAIEPQVMCVTCKIPLNVAQSAQSNRERAFIQSLIDAGEDEAQIKRALVGQYGPTVLALPSTHGFDLAAYLVPAAVVVALVGLLLALLPRWRSQARRQNARAHAAAPLGEADAARLESDLSRFD
jgi:cytochrome c-type biogenesis protein CcmH